LCTFTAPSAPRGGLGLATLPRDEYAAHGRVFAAGQPSHPYVRENARCTSKKLTLENLEAALLPLALDIQAILTVLGRRDRTYEQKDRSLDLTESDIRGVQLLNADLRGADLSGRSSSGLRVSLKNKLMQLTEISPHSYPKTFTCRRVGDKDDLLYTACFAAIVPEPGHCNENGFAVRVRKAGAQSLRQFAEALNELSISAARGRDWSAVQVQRILSAS
jgi:Pentapeptide repeats (8 copies)